MNMRRSGPLQDPEQSFSNYTNATITGLPVELRNQTAALINTLEDNSQALTYGWPTFVGTAVGLVLILPLTLTIGAILRAIIKSITRYAIYWRIFMVFGPLLAFGFFVLSVWGAVFSDLFYDMYSYSWLDEESYLNDGNGFAIAYWACNGLVLVGELWQTYRAWTTKQRPIFWTTLMLLTGACFGLDMTVWDPQWADPHLRFPNSGPDDNQWVYRTIFRLMLLPWLFLGVDVGRRWRSSWLAKRKGDKMGRARLGNGTIN